MSEWAEIVKQVLNSDEVIDRLMYLQSRWADEREYEDFSEYGTAMAKALPDNVKFVQMTKRPFGFRMNVMGKVLKVFIKKRGNSICLRAEVVK